MKRSKKIFGGLFFILVAVYLVVSKLGFLPEIGFFKLILSAFLVCLAVAGIRRLNFGEILFPIALIGIFYDEQLGITELTPWTLLWAALFGSIGLSMLFRGHKRKVKEMEREKCFVGTGAQSADSRVYIENNFSEVKQYVNAEIFEGGTIENNFGSVTVYFDNTVFAEETVKLCVENNFGVVELYIPKEWKVHLKTEHVAGSFEEVGKYVGSSSQILEVRGETHFGTVTIYYV